MRIFSFKLSIKKCFLFKERDLFYKILNKIENEKILILKDNHSGHHQLHSYYKRQWFQDMLITYIVSAYKKI